MASYKRVPAKVKLMRNNKRFPTAMFATATIFSALMVFVIGAVFEQANQPCLGSHANAKSHVDNSVVVNTSGASQYTINSVKPLVMCNRNNQQIGWLTWLFKRSDSVEFHYLDLLELLSRK